jgi:hypothetical protein
MVRIHFGSGKTQDLPGTKLDKMVPMLQQRGLRLMKTVDKDTDKVLVIPLNSSTIEFLEDILEEEPKPEPEPEKTVEEQLQEMKTELEEAVEEVESKKDVEEKRQDIENEFLARANCTHPKELEEVYVQTTAKGTKYFPVCSFCGKRGRYVSKVKLTDEQKANAKPWSDE